ncbi:beta-hydroxyacyl-(acyl-carrier-protein) dehydratase FabZ [Alkaliphilus metalliredigens QYMF]|uniref:3-hydroxyacyl-[acyl-carrier-protein] dehydratase FabZ n=1 Tax=Alkaliphilus metalliredigens (strain QYMF) TaxID=293826 RepID=FABZ_ALKMQ|nr:3-hydroxyacyl-ACP dehydratase FabZ [Alkaliphilus metalliredigens]A6TK84.1 RecName: Full=3-hydroxyacyl-[acyl-carrier-protein] dehydratase FabZ; AltName: Full=(3R)-hydroxymyristoyl-[acyl-carrier-protein] dehydratase; Short=(3R)-hydroxymyristoyl-ACP dehydrase; AltName: Full=Beta-hydroxyacyl-ACP dehydratase [Alkaliphilus metalliredigens QYMF]ABR46602.1 beta-hydroxyacyl-(acyl-carrier-protein) dehydratase FabZ [Alkaliphilus metalliredigens QYMF]
MELNNIEIQKIIPHRYPFLLVDKMVEVELGKRGVGIKNVTANEPFFQGHFPGNPIMPGVLMTEALAQVAALICMGLEENKGKLGVFTGIDKCKFRRQVVPGDVLRLEIEMTALRRGIGKAEGKAYVGEELACSASLTFALINPNTDK